MVREMLERSKALAEVSEELRSWCHAVLVVITANWTVIFTLAELQALQCLRPLGNFTEEASSSPRSSPSPRLRDQTSYFLFSNLAWNNFELTYLASCKGVHDSHESCSKGAHSSLHVCRMSAAG